MSEKKKTHILSGREASCAVRDWLRARGEISGGGTWSVSWPGTDDFIVRVREGANAFDDD